VTYFFLKYTDVLQTTYCPVAARIFGCPSTCRPTLNFL